MTKRDRQASLLDLTAQTTGKVPRDPKSVNLLISVQPFWASYVLRPCHDELSNKSAVAKDFRETEDKASKQGITPWQECPAEHV